MNTLYLILRILEPTIMILLFVLYVLLLSAVIWIGKKILQVLKVIAQNTKK